MTPKEKFLLKVRVAQRSGLSFSEVEALSLKKLNWLIESINEKDSADARQAKIPAGTKLRKLM